VGQSFGGAGKSAPRLPTIQRPQRHQSAMHASSSGTLGTLASSATSSGHLLFSIYRKLAGVGETCGERSDHARYARRSHHQTRAEA
jgi:hypothetical protein